ncbi:MAG: hypothetical protein QMC67_05340 [Candidatus Wallbacteria bacterium]
MIKNNIDCKDKIKDALYKKVVEFQKNQEISCKETVYQSDRVIISAYKFIDELMEIIGAYEEPSEE